MKKNNFMGVDPGIEGAIIILGICGNCLEVHKMPPTIKDKLDLFIGIKERYGNDLFCLVEKVHSRPGDGRKSANTFMFDNGVLCCALTNAGISFDLISPMKWEAGIGCATLPSDYYKKKNALKQKAQSLFPEQKITLWNADAFLIAEYCRRNNK